jgi:hypothetical protein
MSYPVFYRIGIYSEVFEIGVFFLKILKSPEFRPELVNPGYSSLNVFKHLIVESEEMSPSRFDMY